MGNALTLKACPAEMVVLTGRLPQFSAEMSFSAGSCYFPGLYYKKSILFMEIIEIKNRYEV